MAILTTNMLKKILLLLLFLSCVILFYLKMSDTSPRKNFKQFDVKHFETAKSLLAAHINNPIVKKTAKIHDEYYQNVQRDLEDLVAMVAKILQGRDVQSVRKDAIARMKNDAALMDEVKKYITALDDFDHLNSFVRFGYNKTPLILNLAVSKLEDDEYFNMILAGKIPGRFAWNSLTLMGGVEGLDDKASSQISAVAASLFYLLDKKDFASVRENKSSILYNESIAEVLKDNAELLQKIRNNYYLAQGDIISKVYEAYEFGGDKDLPRLYDAKFLPLDCSSGIAYLLGITQDQFSTYHLASYYNEFFQENSVYWTSHDWPIRDKIVKNLQPIKFSGFDKLQAGDIVAWRSLENPKSLTDPKGYVGKGGHIGVVIGEMDGEVYYFSWMRDLEDENKSGFGVDVINIARSGARAADGKIAVSLFRAKN